MENLTKSKERLNVLRAMLRNENISYGELIELQSLRKYVKENDFNNHLKETVSNQ
jgi:hypothetical protein